MPTVPTAANHSRNVATDNAENRSGERRYGSYAAGDMGPGGPRGGAGCLPPSRPQNGPKTARKRATMRHGGHPAGAERTSSAPLRPAAVFFTPALAAKVMPVELATPVELLEPAELAMHP